MRARAVTRVGATRRPGKRKAFSIERQPTRQGLGDAQRDPDDWVDPELEGIRLEEGQMEILLTGHAATHASEAEDNWLVDRDDDTWNER
jgi:hypothetical protein